MGNRRRRERTLETLTRGAFDAAAEAAEEPRRREAGDAGSRPAVELGETFSGSGEGQAAVTVTVRVARTLPVIQCRKSTAIVYFPGTGGRSSRSNFSAAPDLMMLVSNG